MHISDFFFFFVTRVCLFTAVKIYAIIHYSNIKDLPMKILLLPSQALSSVASNSTLVCLYLQILKLLYANYFMTLSTAIVAIPKECVCVSLCNVYVCKSFLIITDLNLSEWEWQTISDSSASLLAAAPGRHGGNDRNTHSLPLMQYILYKPNDHMDIV